MPKDKENKLILHDGSKIGVIGGGPAGSFFSLFAFDFAEKNGLKIEIDIYEPKNFKNLGPTGCNHCGGIVSESLVKMLLEDGIVLPSKVIRRGIESYTLHLENGTATIDSLLSEKRIVSMFRGSGPLGSASTTIQSFDGYLLEQCEKKGAKIVFDKITDATAEPDGIFLHTNQSKKKYDLVVGASGLHPKVFNLYHKLIPTYLPPKTTQAYIREFRTDTEMINKQLGNSMHVFLLNQPGIKFGALIPKENYVTLVLLGSEINKIKVDRFLSSETVRNCFPEITNLQAFNSCLCFPSIVIKNADNPYTDRMVLIGDASSSKLYKNGIGAAYITAKAAANTAINEGISKKDFKKSYQPVCSNLNIDNAVGKLIFFVSTVIQQSAFLKKILFQSIVKEQKKERGKREMSLLLWDTFTGSASYKNILLRSLNPLLFVRLFRNILSGRVSNEKPKK
jgi:flavin-dependent dehydrogenase